MHFKSVLLSFGLLIYASFSWGQKTILSSEAARFAAMQVCDTIALDKLIGNELVYIHSNALVETKADFINSISTGKIEYQNIELEAGSTQRSYRNVGISNGIVKVNGLYSNTPYEVRLRYTAVYHKRRGVWLLVSWQSTKISS